jgi:hypothetical protein
VSRPFYASGKVEDVSGGQRVYTDNAMTFFRLAHTFTHTRYKVEGQLMPESVRCIFFGFGHAEPQLLLKKAGNPRGGYFQISPYINPHTGEPANTIFLRKRSALSECIDRRSVTRRGVANLASVIVIWITAPASRDLPWRH